ncbi:MAG: type III pantothenate kinase [Acidobacteriota bacterium]|nr:MAG: type III pantothenate kinase [Acidobacteriota bacterium]
MLLVIDIGNTNIVLGVFEDDKLKYHWRVSTRRDQTAHEYAVLCRNLFLLQNVPFKEIEAAVICSVVPPLNDSFAHLAEEFFHVNAFFVEPSEQSLMGIRYHHPSEVGADRIVNAIAAAELHGCPAVIVDFGTATTFDAVSPDREYLGGLIAPGIGISSEALVARAAKLPRIEIRKPKNIIGQTTVESMQSGIFHGYVSLVEGVLSRMRKELDNPLVVATGGFARLISSGYTGFDFIEEDLTMHGLRICYERIFRPLNG